MPSNLTQHQLNLVIEGLFRRLQLKHYLPKDLHAIFFEYFQVFQVFWDKNFLNDRCVLSDGLTEAKLESGWVCIRGTEPIFDGTITSWKIQIVQGGQNGADAMGVVSSKTPKEQFIKQHAPWYNQQETKQAYLDSGHYFDHFYGYSLICGLYYGSNMGDLNDRRTGKDVKHLRPIRTAKWYNLSQRGSQTFFFRADFTGKQKKIRILRYVETSKKYNKLGWEGLDYTLDLPQDHEKWYPCASLWDEIVAKAQIMYEEEWEDILKQIPRNMNIS